MTKRIAVLLLVALLVGSFGACTTEKPAPATPPPTVESSVTPESTPTNASSDAQPEVIPVPVATDPKTVLGEVNGKEVVSYTLENANGMKMVVSNYGCQVLELWVPDKDGNLADVMLTPGDFEGLKTQTQSYGRVIGRFANRTGDATFTLEDVVYNLEVNNANRNNIHGGSDNWGYRIWDATPDLENNKVSFSLYSPDGDAGFPGAVTVKVVYTLTEDNEWKLEYTATTNKTTILNLTNHAYFNLAGHDSGSVLEQVAQINSQEITEVRDDGVPTGVFLPVADTVFDFTTPKKIGQDVDDEFEQLSIRKGYDHSYVLNREGRTSEPVLAATVLDEQSGRKLDVYTNQPAVQFYTANYLDGSTKGKDGAVYDARSGFCLETQGYPDAIHHPEFPTSILTVEEPFESTTIYKFGTV